MTTKNKKDCPRSNLRVDPFHLLEQLCKQHTTLVKLQQDTGFDPAEMKRLRAAKKVRLDTLNRIAEGLNVPPDSLLITPDSPWTTYEGDETNRDYGFRDAFQVLVDYSPYEPGPLFK